MLLKVAPIVRERLEEIATIEARKGGKPIQDARGENGAVAASFEYLGEAANKIFGETVPLQDAGLAVTLREPVGACALIVPWNFPLVIMPSSSPPRSRTFSFRGVRAPSRLYTT